MSESDEGRLSTISDTPDVISCATPFATNISFGYDNPMSDVEEANPEDPDSVMAEFDDQMEDLLDFAFPPSLQMPFQSGLTSGTMVEDYQPVSVPLVDYDTCVFDEDAMQENVSEAPLQAQSLRKQATCMCHSAQSWNGRLQNGSSRKQPATVLWTASLQFQG